jgi:nucleoside-diphosphate-sugar epimerase
LSVYVIGKSGYIGRSLMEYLTDIDLEPIGIGRSDPLPEFTTDDTIINAACAGWRPEQRDDWRDTITSNVLLPLEIERKRNGANLIHFSTGAESIPEMLSSGYVLTKRIASEMLTGKAHIVYLYTIWGGTHEPPYRFMASLLKAAASKEHLTVTSPFVTRDFVHIDRLMPLIGRLISTKDYRTIQFGTGNARTLAQVIGTLDAVVPGLNVSMQYVGADYFPYCADVPFLTRDTFAEDLRKEYYDKSNYIS